MRRASRSRRRVTAQRKFAQGAFVPPAANAGPSGGVSAARASRSTRRVTAQRKFAQGAFLPLSANAGTNGNGVAAARPQNGAAAPPAAAAAAAAPAAPAAAAVPERRELPVPGLNRECRTFMNNMSPASLLDIICFQGYVETYYQPVVLLERLREDRNAQNLLRERGNRANIAHHRAKPKKGSTQETQKKVNKAAHKMKLRYRRDKPKTSCCASSTGPSNKPKLVISKVVQKVVQKVVPTLNRIVKRKPPLRRRKRNETLEFSLDDNRPLKYFASSSTPKTSTGPPKTGAALSKPVTALKEPAPSTSKAAESSADPADPIFMEDEEVSEDEIVPGQEVLPDDEILPDDVDRYSDIIRLRPVPPNENNEDNQTGTNDNIQFQTLQIKMPMSVDEMETATTVKIEEVKDETESVIIIENEGVQLTPQTINTNNHRVAKEPETNGALQHISSINSQNDSYGNFYSRSRICSWISNTSKAKPNAMQKEPQPSTSPVDSQPSTQQCINVCPAANWTSLQEVTNVDDTIFDSRCKDCSHCKRLQKLLDLTSLLKKQKKIDCLTEESLASLPHASRDNVESGTSESHETLVIELLPPHPHLLIKIKIRQNSDGKEIVTSCLIPRLDSTERNEFKLNLEHEDLLDQVIVNLSVSMCENSSKSTKSMKSGKMAADNMTDDAEEDSDEDDGAILNAPSFWPTQDEFSNPIAYFEKIFQYASKFGICKIVPPTEFIPPCNGDDSITFEVFDQYISRMFNRWGLAARKMSAIKASAQAQGVEYNRNIMFDNVELNIPKLYQIVKKYGGFENVYNGNKFGKVAEALKLNKSPKTARRLERIYAKYILPFESLSPGERHEFLIRAESKWQKKNKRLLDHAINPLHHQKKLLGDSDSSDEEKEESHDAEDCIKPGSTMNLAQFKKIAGTVQSNLFRNKLTNERQIEEEYWQTVMAGTDHVCVHSASIDTGELGLGFPKGANKPYAKHPWNLKQFSENPSNMLRFLGPALGVTVPTLHLGMVWSTSCWHRDPHSIPWIEYVHQGPTKIWYGVPEHQEEEFRNVTNSLHPIACQNKSLWLPSDISMVPPASLRNHGVKVYRVEQNSGEFVVVMPRAYSCSVATGYTVSESTYFATQRWLDTIMPIFKEIRESCEPTMFTLEQLLKNIAEDVNTPLAIIKKIRTVIEQVFELEMNNQKELKMRGIKKVAAEHPECGPQSALNGEPRVWNVRDLDECEICRCTLYLSAVKDVPFPNSMFCSSHALELLRKPKYKDISVDNARLVCYYTNEQMSHTLNIVRNRIELNE